MSFTVNPDLAKERHGNLNLQALTRFLGETRSYFRFKGDYDSSLILRDQMLKKIKPISEENFYNLSRDEQYQMIIKKSLEVCEYARENNIDLKEAYFATNSVFGTDKFAFGLHLTAFLVPIDLWGTDEQRKYWEKEVKEKPIFGTYVQTEIGHGTYIRGLETTATYDRTTQEFVINSPTLTSTKFWPGGAGKTCNYALVMAQLIIDGKDHGLHGFVVQLRSLKDHSVMPNLELGDIGVKAGFTSVDNGYVRFKNLRIPLNHMLMKHAVVTPNGEFKRVGNEIIMYACMLLLRAILSQNTALNLSITTTIAIRYSCVRRQTAGTDGIEPQIIDYKTQQYRLFPALATAYAYLFSSSRFIRNLISVKETTNDFETINPVDLNRIHSVTAGLKAMGFINGLKFSQSNRLCCGGHGYNLASGIPQLVVDFDAGSSYEGDNIVLLLQTARFLLKCAQKNNSPHIELPNINELKSTKLYQRFEEYFRIYYKLYDESMGEISNKMLYLITEKGFGHFQAWNETSVQLINLAQVYIHIYVINSFIDAIHSHKVEVNQKALCELFELFVLYDICDSFSSNVLRLNVIDSQKMTEYNEKLGELLPKIRVNAVLLVDAFGWLDANLCSALGAYDGRAYERLLEFAKNSKFNDKEIHEAYEKYQKPYAERLLKSKI